MRWLQEELPLGLPGALQFPVVCPAALISIPRKAKLAQWSVGVVKTLEPDCLGSSPSATEVTLGKSLYHCVSIAPSVK